MKVRKHSMRLLASPRAVITQFLYLPGESRVSNIVHRVLEMDESVSKQILEDVYRDFQHRHRNIQETLSDHYGKASAMYHGNLNDISETKKLLIGAYFTKEYSIQSAALFNPSIVAHPRQDGLSKGEKRFIISLRATGEGHISSIVFQTGVINRDGKVTLDQSDGYYSTIARSEDTVFNKNDFMQKFGAGNSLDRELFDSIPASFSHRQLLQSSATFNKDPERADQLHLLESFVDKNYELVSPDSMPINEQVIFPTGRAESMGMEDVRFVEFTEGDETMYYGTYTAYDGRQIVSQLIETKDFKRFNIRSLNGAAVADKGMALFPGKVDGKYVMISRQGGEKINIMFSPDLYQWNSYQTLMEPKYPWELVQLGNCGSPIKTSKGWLLLTHGVGVVRTYVISAILLDLKNPSTIIGRLSRPLIQPEETEREGYVPNVVYTCGMMLHENILLIPYAVSDSATDFATVSLDELLNELLSTPYNEQ